MQVNCPENRASRPTLVIQRMFHWKMPDLSLLMHTLRSVCVTQPNTRLAERQVGELQAE